METAIQKLAAVALLIVGLSHILQARMWVSFFVMLREKGEAGVVANALMHLWPGLLITSFHNLWQGLPMILTVYGWLLVIKGAVYLIRPSIGLRSLGLVQESEARKFALVGVPMVMIGLTLGWSVFVTGR